MNIFAKITAAAALTVAGAPIAGAALFYPEIVRGTTRLVQGTAAHDEAAAAAKAEAEAREPAWLRTAKRWW